MSCERRVSGEERRGEEAEPRSPRDRNQKRFCDVSCCRRVCPNQLSDNNKKQPGEALDINGLVVALLGKGSHCFVNVTHFYYTRECVLVTCETRLCTSLERRWFQACGIFAGEDSQSFHSIQEVSKLRGLLFGGAVRYSAG
ncbi:hypothetical protein F2P81_009337 [Scophthalmus maximus]|uniref:Uncharacterized protein n=1 Tax=Scophthalmus maximus TaxID=52904 RepID=A0A6A4SYG9_SCOMX|nr:hypothetical protein F2P81_009337 [Scophthalmus maximus]